MTLITNAWICPKHFIKIFCNKSKGFKTKFWRFFKNQFYNHFKVFDLWNLFWIKFNKMKIDTWVEFLKKMFDLNEKCLIFILIRSHEEINQCWKIFSMFSKVFVSVAPIFKGVVTTTNISVNWSRFLEAKKNVLQFQVKARFFHTDKAWKIYKWVNISNLYSRLLSDWNWTLVHQ